MNTRRIVQSQAGVVLVAGLAALYGTTALSQSAQPGSENVIQLGAIFVGSDTVADELRDRLTTTAGAADVVGREDIEEIPNPAVADALATVPGVIVQELFGSNDQPRIQIRGSGTQQNPTERGVLILKNGMPVNRADGSYIVGFASPGNAEAIEVWRGAAANRLGASVLGGAVNFISPTAQTDPTTRLRFNAGSFGQIGASGQTSVASENVGVLFQFELNDKDGFRDINNQSQRNSVEVNATIEHSDTAATQLFMSYTDLEFGVPGPVTANSLETNPEAVHSGPTMVRPGVLVNPGPNVPRDMPRRKADQLLAGVRTTFDIEDSRFDFGLSASDTDDSFRFPISASERVTDGWDANISARYAYRPDSANGLPLIEATLNHSYGKSDRSYYHNVGGARGPQFGENDLSASTSSVFVGANLLLAHNLVLSPSVSYTRATRTNEDVWAPATRPTVGYNPGKPDMRLPDGQVPTRSNSYDQTYSGWSPRLAIAWTPKPEQTVWAALSRSFEPPTHDDLLATRGGTPLSGPGRPMPPRPSSNAPAFSTADLEAQEADTLEIGWRGRLQNDWAWDVTAYHSRVRNEILSLRDATASPRGSVNADRTVHNGIEAGLSGYIAAQVSARFSWTFQDFRFDDDPVRGDNRLAGAPRHVLNASIAWEATDKLTLFGSTKWVPEKTAVDNMNTLFADPYFVADLRAEYMLHESASLQAGITNLFDEKYASSTVIVDASRPDQAVFIPGEGRAFYIGAAFQF